MEGRGEREREEGGSQEECNEHKGRKGDFNSSKKERDRRRCADDAMRAGVTQGGAGKSESGRRRLGGGAGVLGRVERGKKGGGEERREKEGTEGRKRRKCVRVW